MALHDVAGIAGSSLIVVAYLLLQVGRLRADHLAWPALNAAGAALVLFSLTVDFNLGAFVLESFWLLISGIGLARIIASRSPQSSRPGSR